MREKERLLVMQKEKYEHLEKERFEIDLERMRAERAKEESEHVKK